MIVKNVWPLIFEGTFKGFLVEMRKNKLWHETLPL
jgi:hypothetical protein